MIRTLLVVALAVMMPARSMAQSFNRGAAEAEMVVRVMKAAEDAARTYGLSTTYVVYCQTKLELSVRGLPLDGRIPYGVNNLTASENTVKIALQTQEKFEVGFLTLCLAEASNTLAAANARAK